MKYFIPLLVISLLVILSVNCRPTKHITKAIKPKDSTGMVVVTRETNADSARLVDQTMENLKQRHIDFRTFNARIKVEYQDSKGKQPDIIAVVRVIKDSAIWVSLSASLLNIEVYRMLITRDSVILMNTRSKEVQYRSLDYLQDLTEIPFDYATLQDLLIGNPIFNQGKVLSFKKSESHVLVLTVGEYFKHLLTLSADNFLLLHSKLDDVEIARNRTADITYDDYVNQTGFPFSTYREITVSEKNKLDIRLNFKTYEFNKDLSVSFRVPKNYRVN